MPYTTESKGAVAKDASGGRGSWMSKHSQSNMGGSPMKLHNKFTQDNNIDHK